MKVPRVVLPKVTLNTILISFVLNLPFSIFFFAHLRFYTSAFCTLGYSDVDLFEKKAQHSGILTHSLLLPEVDYILLPPLC